MMDIRRYDQFPRGRRGGGDGDPEASLAAAVIRVTVSVKQAGSLCAGRCYLDDIEWTRPSGEKKMRLHDVFMQRIVKG